MTPTPAAIGAVLSDRELDALVAEKLMGWHWIASPHVDDKQWAEVCRKPALFPPKATAWAIHVNAFPRYSTDHAAAYAMEAEIERRGLAEKYIDALTEIVRVGAIRLWRGLYNDDVFKFVHATPRQKAEAALAAAVDKA